MNNQETDNSNNSLVSLKSYNTDFEVEYDIQPVIDINDSVDERKKRIVSGQASVDEELSLINDKLSLLNKDIDRLTNHADGLDYAIAVTSGIITGIIDATIDGEWNFKEAREEACKDTENKVIKFAQKKPDYNDFCSKALEGKGNSRLKPKDPNSLETAVEYLEWKFPLPGDGAFNSGQFGISAGTHRIDDLCHHPTIVGLICSVIVQFTGKTVYVNKYDEKIKIPVTVNDYGEFEGSNFVTKLFSGIINWFITCAKTITNRKGHLLSDVSTPAGLPGSILSIITELSAIPCFKNEDFKIKLRQAYENGIGTGKGQVDLGVFNSLFEGPQSKLDVNTEKAIASELKRQAMPVVLNEIIVRGFYFIRHFVLELKEKQSLDALEWNKILPVNNRTIIRMLTIATGTFTTIDMADAAIRAAGKSADAASFFSNMILRVNFVGVGRFAIAVGTDAFMGLSRHKKSKLRMKMQEQQLLLLQAKVFYKQADVWIAAESVEKTLDDAYRLMEDSTVAYAEAEESIKDSFDRISDNVCEIEKKNPGLISKIDDTLKWG